MVDNIIDSDAATFPDSATITAGEPPPLSELLNPEAPGNFHGEILQKIRLRRRLGEEYVNVRKDAWDQVDEKQRLFIDLARPAKRADGSLDTTTREMPFNRAIVIPASYAIHEVRKAQQMSLWSRKPIIPLEGRGPEDVRAAKIVEAKLDWDLEQSRFLLSLWSFLQDADKYGIGAFYDTWEVEQGWVYGPPPIQRIAPMLPPVLLQIAQGIPALTERTKEWGSRKEFTRVVSVDPFTLWRDPRAPASAPYLAEFMGHGISVGHSYLLERAEPLGPYFNVELAKKYAGQQRNRAIGEGRSRSRTTVGGSVSVQFRNQLDKHDKGFYDLDHMQIRLIPKAWKLGDSDKSEIWWFSMVNDSLIVRAHANPYDHGDFSYSLGEPNLDPHVMSNPGVMENLNGPQRFIDWLFNSRIENVQRVMNDRYIYPEEWIRSEDMENPAPGQHVRLTQAGLRALAEGRVPGGIDGMYSQVKIQDVTAGNMGMIEFLFSMMQQLGASSDPAQGQPVTPERTLGEVQSIMAASSQRVGITARILDAMAITPMVNRAVANLQQFTDAEQYVRIAGDMAKETGGLERLLVKPTDLYGNFDYQPISGLIQSDPSRHSETWLQVLKVMIEGLPILLQQGQIDGKVPDIRAVINETIRSLGIKNIEGFYTQLPMPQVMPDQAVAAGQQSGQIVPMDALMPSGGLPS